VWFAEDVCAPPADLNGTPGKLRRTNPADPARRRIKLLGAETWLIFMHQRLRPVKVGEAEGCLKLEN